MSDTKSSNLPFLGICFIVGALILGYFFSSGIVKFKKLDRTVTVKGLAEKEVPANIAIWRIQFGEVSNSLDDVYDHILSNTDTIRNFLVDNGFTLDEISSSMPTIEDRSAQPWLDQNKVAFRYTSNSTVTVYSTKVDLVRQKMNDIVALGKKGIAISGSGYRSNTEFLFTGLNDIKPGMIEEATRNAREVAVKFAEDSDSKLGKIRTASQGQFSIDNRDSNTPYIKKVRVVSTLEYYLTD